MLTAELVLIVGMACGVGILVLAGLLAGRDDELDPEVESTNWRRADAEVISVLRSGDRTFLLVRFPVGTSLIRNDVRYPLPGGAPHAGQRVPIKYDPAAPARIVFDLPRYNSLTKLS
ncbi:hypothetical protein [Kribbella sp. NPDC051620]|uniref:hypothetical protein n=1 Tax=Kribbella sp. NPDC051620 TaxID=3364120 RepID=UPI0037BE185C